MHNELKLIHCAVKDFTCTLEINLTNTGSYKELADQYHKHLTRKMNNTHLNDIKSQSPGMQVNIKLQSRQIPPRSHPQCHILVPQLPRVNSVSPNVTLYQSLKIVN